MLGYCAAMEKVKAWPVEKYARFVSGSAASSVHAAVDAASSTAKKTEGVWQVKQLYNSGALFT